MSVRITHLFGLIAAAGIGTGTLVSAPRSAGSPRELIVHEWGTFTTVAGTDGAASDWLPLGGPTDLPCFVEHFQNRPTIKIAPEYAGGPVIDYERARTSLLGRVRMETPVLYFYGGQDTTVNVKVRFPHGLMTEWYPHANVMEMIIGPKTLKQNNPPATDRVEQRARQSARGARVSDRRRREPLLRGARNRGDAARGGRSARALPLL